MKYTLFSSDFIFINNKFRGYHYTDHRKGSPMNYLAYMKEGTARIVSNDRTIEIKKGDLFFIPKNLPYQSYWYGSDKIDCLSYGFQKLNTHEPANFALQVISCDRSIVDTLLQIPANNRVTCKSLSLFYLVMDRLLPGLEPSYDSNEEALAAKIKHCIHDHPHHSISEIAKMCSISEPYLYALFKKAEQITPNDYRQKVLCNTGIELLLTTDKKIEEISDLLRFSSGSYFRKVFKKHTGTTPHEIRKQRAF